MARNGTNPITQIIYLNIPVDRDLKETDTYHGGIWKSALDLIERSDGFERLYWGRSLEEPEHAQLHVVRQTLQHHESFMKSYAKDNLAALLHILASTGSENPVRAIRYVALKDLTPNCQALGRGAPYTGTAIYLKPNAAWHEGAWPLWTHIVRYVDGCLGCAGGDILEPTELLTEPWLIKGGEVRKGYKWEGYLVYVGWETVEKHEAYHHTQHFKDHRVILRCGNEGYAEYGHICFEGSRESAVGSARL